MLNLYKYLIIFCGTVLLSCGSGEDEPAVIIETDRGDIRVKIFAEKAPLSSAAFLSYVDKELYKNATFYRVLSDDEIVSENNSGLIQGGIHESAPQKIPAQGILHEPTDLTGLSHTTGTISLARTTPGSASSEFFICIGDRKMFDAGNNAGGDSLGFAAFGEVTRGMDIVRKIQQQPADGDRFRESVRIKTIRRL